MMSETPVLYILEPSGWQDYALLDSGDGLKLEQFGAYRTIRPEAQAMWSRQLDDTEWDQADAVFTADGDDKGRWQLGPDVPPRWDMQFDSIRFHAMPTPFRHLGFFPEQSPHWRWSEAQIKAFIAHYGRAPKILNLFAYSGLASLHAARAGADVTHLDASKKAISQAFDNRALSEMDDAPIRFITDDASRFVEREARRGRLNDGIMLDPPKYGRGPKGEVWRLAEDLPQLLRGCQNILSSTPLFLLVTIYAIRTSTMAVRSAVSDSLGGIEGQLDAGELVISEKRPGGRHIGQALYVRWLASAFCKP